MTTTAKLIDTLTANLGIPGTDAETHARALHEAGLLPDEGPASFEDAANLLIAVMTGGAVEPFTALPLSYVLRFTPKPGSLEGRHCVIDRDDPASRIWPGTLGEVVTSVIELWTEEDTGPRGIAIRAFALGGGR